jgi:hypothetical protein
MRALDSLSTDDLADVLAVYAAESRDVGSAICVRGRARQVARRVRMQWLKRIYPVSAMRARGYRCRLENRPDDTVRWYVRSADGELMQDDRERQLSAKEAWVSAREVIARKDGVL